MGEQSAIAWTHRTWNPWQGCHKVSRGCRLCYMFREKKRYGQEPNVVVRSKPATFNAPLSKKWTADKPLVFTCSWSDWFIEEADAWRDEAWAIIDKRRDLIFQIVTKRIDRAAVRLPWTRGNAWPHVWGIVSAEDQKTADERIPVLLETDFAVRGVSYEPALGPIDFAPWLWADLDGRRSRLNLLHWIIFGGESADRSEDAAPCNLAWAYSTIAQGRAAGVAIYMKQLGARPYRIVGRGSHPGEWSTQPEYLTLGDRKGGVPSEWPQDVVVREFPIW